MLNKIVPYYVGVLPEDITTFLNHMSELNKSDDDSLRMSITNTYDNEHGYYTFCVNGTWETYEKFLNLSWVKSIEHFEEMDRDIKPQITIDEYFAMEAKIDIRIGTVIAVERIPKSDKMLKLKVSFGETERTVVTNIGNRIDEPETKLVRVQFPFIMNLPPSKIMGVVSEAMIIVVENDQYEIELGTDGQFTDGAKLM